MHMSSMVVHINWLLLSWDGLPFWAWMSLILVSFLCYIWSYMVCNVLSFIVKIAMKSLGTWYWVLLNSFAYLYTLVSVSMYDLPMLLMDKASITSMAYMELKDFSKLMKVITSGIHYSLMWFIILKILRKPSCLLSVNIFCWYSS